jgi:hypothetical protein
VTDPRHRDLLRAAAAHGLDGAPAFPSPPRDLAAWGQVVRAATHERVLGLLAGAVADGALELDADQHEVLADAHEAWCAHDLRLEHLLVRIADALDAAGIPSLVVKGPALAHRWYPDPSRRLFADLDLVVPSDRFLAAAELLRAELGATASTDLRTGFAERYGKETLLRVAPGPTTPLGVEVDLHRTPIAGALGLAIRLEDLFEAPGEVLLGGRAMAVPDPTTALLLACYQATVADIPSRLVAWRDVAQILTDPQSPSPESVVATAARWQAGAVAAAAIGGAAEALGLAADRHPAFDARLVRWAEAYRPTTRQRIVLSAHTRPGHVYWRQAAGVLVLRGAAARAAYVRALVVPDRRYLASRGWTWSAHARRAGRLLTGPLRQRVVGWGRRVGRYRLREPG